MAAPITLLQGRAGLPSPPPTAVMLAATPFVRGAHRRVLGAARCANNGALGAGSLACHKGPPGPARNPAVSTDRGPRHVTHGKRALCHPPAAAAAGVAAPLPERDSDMASLSMGTHDAEWDVEWLARFPPFAWLTSAALSELIASTNVVSVAAGDTIMQASAPITDMVIVRMGLVVRLEETGSGPAAPEPAPGAQQAATHAASPEAASEKLLGAGSALFFEDVVLSATTAGARAAARAGRPAGRPVGRDDRMTAGRADRMTAGKPAGMAVGGVGSLGGEILQLPAAPTAAAGAGSSVSGLHGPLVSDATYVARTALHLWCIPVQVACSLVRTRQQEYALALSRSMAASLMAAQAQLAASRRRERALAPYLVSAPERGMIGNSAFADRLRKQLVQAARDTQLQPVLLFGEPGNFKANLAALIHFGSRSRGAPMVRLACERLDSVGSELFGRGSKRGLLSLLQDAGPGCTLLLDDVHKAPPSLLPALHQLLAERSWRAAPVAGGIQVGGAKLPLQLGPQLRVVMTAERSVPLLEGACRVIKVPPLRVRSADIPALASYFLTVAARNYTSAGVMVVGGGPAPPRDAGKAVDAVPSLVMVGAPTSPLPEGTPEQASAQQQQQQQQQQEQQQQQQEVVVKRERWTLSPEAVRRLQAYNWPRNEQELFTTIARAAAQHAVAVGEAPRPSGSRRRPRASGAEPVQGPVGDLLQKLTLTGVAGQGSNNVAAGAGSKATAAAAGGAAAAAAAAAPEVEVQQLPEELVWFGAGAQPKDALRYDLLQLTPLLRNFLRSNTWPDAINFKFTAYAFPIIVAMLLWGPQDRDHNAILNFFWAWWWPGIFLVYPFLGRVWCAVCPFMIYGELVQRARLAMGATLRKWPRVEGWGPWFLFTLFAGILVWEEVWDLPHTAALSGWLLILITAGAMVCSALFERRLWCRHLCPIGGMNGMFAKASLLELRARQGVCAGSCATYHCYKGGPEEAPEGLDTGGCPLYSHPAQLTDNRNCVLCMTCLKACPHRSVELRLRPPLADLWDGSHTPLLPELALLALLGGAVPLHAAPLLVAQLGLDPQVFTVGITPVHLALSTVVLAAPAVLITLADQLGRQACQQAGARLPAPLLSLGYAYMPLVWGGTLAFYERPLLDEAGCILQVSVAMAGLDSWAHYAPALTADPAVISFLQGATLLFATACSLVLLRRIGDAPWPSLAPHVALTALTLAELWALIVH